MSGTSLAAILLIFCSVPSFCAPNSQIPGRAECGKQEIGDRIFGGDVTEIDEFPWMALLFYKISSASQQLVPGCGGALISDQYVLTAAHCVLVEMKNPGGLEMVRLGEFNVDSAKDCFVKLGYEDCSDDPVDMPPESISIHPDYKPTSKNQQNDIALIRLSQKVQFTDFIKPICLPDSKVFTKPLLTPGNRLHVAGWGRYKSDMNSPVKLKVEIPILKIEECQEVYQRRFMINLDESQVCAGGEDGKDSCKGDSGGPLMALDSIFGNWIVAGVVSIGPNTCGKSEVPGIYTNVNYFLPWIHSTIK